ncbi:hypothetical protein [Alkalicoccus halolimnae]|uniref:Uncharacterized protein n=1 Tax=Alkalicoccus halolimnae TaxID=1667239 RepID=A0A5C7F1U4_9BACI|nr:hypothetical protein [Alkalicoccus halolimnae]TXF82328.1 hypothetical protein FTX54_14860 [Alkalicoccus halolimnae]
MWIILTAAGKLILRYIYEKVLLLQGPRILLKKVFLYWKGETTSSEGVPSTAEDAANNAFQDAGVHPENSGAKVRAFYIQGSLWKRKITDCNIGWTTEKWKKSIS